jgi:hypothetical protein
MRIVRIAAAIATVAACCGGCADATGIVVTAVPVDQAVMGADSLKVFVGHDTLDVRPAIHAHFDDGNAVPLQVDSFVEPTDILLSGKATGDDLWVVVRAFDGSTVVGEGGVPFPLQIVDGEVGAIRVDVERVQDEPAFMPNCPGAGPRDDRHYIVTDLATDDCDLDHDTAAGGDCDDFDPLIGAMTGSRYCVVTEGGGCRIGTQSCSPDGTTACTPVTGSLPVDTNACVECEGSGEALAECLRNAVPIVTCDVNFVPDQFCLPAGVPSLGPEIWYEPEGPVQMTGITQWRLQPPTTMLAFGWIENMSTFVPDATNQIPAWPAIKAISGTNPVVDGHTDSVLAVTATPAVTAVLVDFRYHLEGSGTCPDTAERSCQTP